MTDALKLKDRYELRETLGSGGMGVVYRAYDWVLKCDVAVKTLHQASNPTALQLFYRECEVLVALNHPNIVPILDIGEFEYQGRSQPYFVMPLLPGATLDKLIQNRAAGLTVQRRVEILVQVSRGLHAAHEHGLIHRDIKPGNVFVMPDYSAEIIDFGVAHVVDAGATGVKGTLYYMAPELITGKPPTAASDIFALGVMAYELFAGRRPFEKATEREMVEAILHESPPPVSEVDLGVSQDIGRVIHKAIAKQPWHRFATPRAFADCLEMAYRGQPIECFDPALLLPRVARAKAAFERGDHQFAMEILTELEAEGHIDPELSILRRQIDVAARQKLVRQLLDSAHNRLEAEEYPLALQKVQEALAQEPDHAEGLALKSKIERARSEGQIEGWFRLARQHIDNNAFTHAREALQNVLKIRSQDTRALALLSEVGRREQEYLRGIQEKEQLYHAAMEAWQKGDVSGAMTRLERVLDLDRRAPDSAHQERSNAYHNLYNQVRSDHDAMREAYDKARTHLADRDFGKALAICDQYLQRFPGHALFQSLRFDAMEQQRLQLSACVAEIDRRVEAETDLERKVAIVAEAAARFPGEPHFEHLARIMRERANLVNAIVAKARYHEERGQFTEALGQWEILRTIHARYPGLQFEMDRVAKRRGQQVRMEGKARWAEQIDSHLEAGEYAGALESCRAALQEFPEDGELLALRQLASQAQERCGEALRLEAEGERLFDGGAFDEGLECLRQARFMDEHNAAIRAGLLNRLVMRAQRLVESDPAAAEKLTEEALRLDPAHAGAKGVRLLLDDLRRESFLNQSISRVRQLQAAGDLVAALAELDQALSFYPGEQRLLQLRSALEGKAAEAERSRLWQRDLERLRGLAAGAALVAGPADLQAIVDEARGIAGRYPEERPFQSIVAALEGRARAAAVAQRHAAMAAPTNLVGDGPAGVFASAGAAPPQPSPAAAPPPAGATAILSDAAGLQQPEATPLSPAATAPSSPARAQLPRPLPRPVFVVAMASLVVVGCAGTWLLLRHPKPAPVQTTTVIRATQPEPSPAQAPPATEIPAAPKAPAALKANNPSPPADAAEPPSVPAPPTTARITRPPQPILRTMDPADWDHPWARDGEWYVRQGGDLVTWRITPTAGTFQFTLRPKSSSAPFANPKVQWLLGFLDDRNYILFELDKQSYSCSEYTHGRKTVRVSKKKHGVKGGVYSVRMAVARDRVEVMLASDSGELATIDEWNWPGRDFTVLGRFGLSLPGDARIWLANFTFRPLEPASD